MCHVLLKGLPHCHSAVSETHDSFQFTLHVARHGFVTPSTVQSSPPWYGVDREVLQGGNEEIGDEPPQPSHEVRCPFVEAHRLQSIV
jgi:hypothetical protein